MMKRFYWLYGAIVLLLVVLKIFGLIGWWGVTAPIWFPICVALSDSLMMVITTDMGNYWKKKQEKKIPETCETCLYRKVMDFTDEKECLGEKMKAEKKDGKCPYYTKHVEGLEK